MTPRLLRIALIITAHVIAFATNDAHAWAFCCGVVVMAFTWMLYDLITKART